MEFYYPAPSKITYHITFDWGEYIITTEDNQNAEVHADSKPYLGYITFRPKLSKQSTEEKQPFYLVTPNGDVWENTNGKGIPEVSKRQEVTQEKTANSTTTKTLTIQSVSEPIIDHFKSYPEQWTRYGKLECRGNRTRLKLES
ncbi:hypothetical protein [[Eubacterium] cellulosolvens]